VDGEEKKEEIEMILSRQHGVNRWFDGPNAAGPEDVKWK
jgi:hypothetical protein